MPTTYSEGKETRSEALAASEVVQLPNRDAAAAPPTPAKPAAAAKPAATSPAVKAATKQMRSRTKKAKK